MLDTGKCYARALAVKKKHDFPTDDIVHELSRAKDEIEEAIYAQKSNKSPEEIGKELADTFIFLISAAHIIGIDFDKAVLNKLSINEGRTWETDKH